MKFFYIVVFVLQLNILIINGLSAEVLKSKPNVLFIIVDDLRPLPDVSLPAIEKLAAKSVSFKNAFAQQALCAPSRNSLLTGRRPDALRLYDFHSYWRRFAGNFTTMPQYFKESGYSTYSVGKVFHPGPSSNKTDDFPYSWTYPPYHPPTEIYKDAPVCNDPVTKHLQSDLLCPVNVKKQPGKSLPDLQILKHAIGILKKSATKPFFLAVGFHKPHIPFKFPQEYLDLVPLNTVHPPKHPEIPEKMPTVAWHPWLDVRHRDDIARLCIPFPMGTMPKKWTLKIRQHYYAAAKYIDALIGQLLEHVDLKKTIVVLTSDHGWSLGENGAWAKYSNFDVALRVPLIISAPGLPRRSVDTPVELIDIFPTLTNLTGLKAVPKCRNSIDKRKLCFEGKSLVPLINKEKIISFAISQYPRPSIFPQIDTDKPKLKDIKIMGYSIRTKRFRYTVWIAFDNKKIRMNWDKKYGEELYDHVMDPDESNNINSVPKYNIIQQYLFALLKSKIDPKLFNDNRSEK